MLVSNLLQNVSLAELPADLTARIISSQSTDQILHAGWESTREVDEAMMTWMR